MRKLLLALIFLEGGSVMACELLGAKLIGPFFGNSIYVWASVLGVTLTALMTGYYAGGYFSSKGKKETFFLWTLGLAGIFLAIMPYTANAIMSTTINMSVQAGSTIAAMVFLFPPLVLMGTSTPIIISTLNEDESTAGKYAGYIYAFSTLGGIVVTFLMGFYMLPELGIRVPAFIFGGILAGLSWGALLLKGKMAALVLLPILGFIGMKQSKGVNDSSQTYNVVYSEEGVLGQVKVIDMPFNTWSRGAKRARILFVNNINQSLMDMNATGHSLWDWSYYFPAAASRYPKGSKALMLGLGGGTFVKHYDRLGFDIDVVELNESIVDVAKKYFFLPEVNITVDDARHFVNRCEKKYDFIHIDLFHSESPPAHALTYESFDKMKNLINDDGMLMFNFYGYLKGPKGLATRSLIKTLKKLDLTVELFPTPGKEDSRNMIIIASKHPLDFTNTKYSDIGLPQLQSVSRYFIDYSDFDFSDAEVLYDADTKLEKMYTELSLEWRSVINDVYAKRFINEGLMLND